MWHPNGSRTLTPRLAVRRSAFGIPIGIRRRPLISSHRPHRAACLWNKDIKPLTSTEDKKHVDVQHQEALLLFKSGQRKKGLRKIRQAREQYPDNVYLCTSAGVMEGKMGNADEARQLFQHALDLNPLCVPALSVSNFTMIQKSLHRLEE